MTALFHNMIGNLQISQSLLDRTNKLRKMYGQQTLVQTCTPKEATMINRAQGQLLQMPSSVQNAMPYFPVDEFRGGT